MGGWEGQRLGSWRKVIHSFNEDEVSSTVLINDYEVADFAGGGLGHHSSDHDRSGFLLLSRFNSPTTSKA